MTRVQYLNIGILHCEWCLWYRNNLFIIQACVTKDGPDPKKPCVFPFNDRGLSHSKCTKGTSGGKPWCPTEVDERGYYLDGKWGNCPSSLVCGTGSTSFVLLNPCFFSWVQKDLSQQGFQNTKVFFPGTIKQATRDLVPNAAEKKCVCGQGVEKYDIKTFEVERVFFLGLLCLASTGCLRAWTTATGPVVHAQSELT